MLAIGKILKWYPEILLAMGKTTQRVPGDLLARYSYGKNTQMVPGDPVSYGKNTQIVPGDLLARYSGTMYHHAKDFLWPRGRRGGCCYYSASQQQYSCRLQLYSQSISSSRTLLATVLSSGKNTTTDSMRACMNVQKTQFLL